MSNKKDMSLRERIIAVDDTKRQREKVPEWEGLTVEVRSLSGTQRANLMRQAAKESEDVDPSSLYVTLLTDALYDPVSGKRIFEPGDAEALLGKNSAVLERLGRIAFRLSGLGAGAIDESVKN